MARTESGRVIVNDLTAVDGEDRAAGGGLATLVERTAKATYEVFAGLHELRARRTVQIAGVDAADKRGERLGYSDPITLIKLPGGAQA